MKLRFIMAILLGASVGVAARETHSTALAVAFGIILVRIIYRDVIENRAVASEQVAVAAPTNDGEK